MVVDPSSWVIDHSFAEFVLLRTVQIKFMCMLGYTFYHGYKVFSKLPPTSSTSFKFVNFFMACTGGGILVPIFLNAIPVPLKDDLYPISIICSFVIHLYFPMIREVLGLSALFKALIIILYETTRAYVVVAFTSASAAAIPASQFSFPLFGPIFCGTIAGCGGAFLPMNKGLDPIRSGMPTPVLTALVGSTVFHIFMNTWFSDGCIDAKKKAHFHMTIFFIVVGLVSAFGLTNDALKVKKQK